MLKSKCKVFTLPVQRKQTPYASCPVIRKRFLSWYYYYTQSLENYQLVFTILLFLSNNITVHKILTKLSNSFSHFPFNINNVERQQTNFFIKKMLSNLPIQQSSGCLKNIFPPHKESRDIRTSTPLSVRISWLSYLICYIFFQFFLTI